MAYILNIETSTTMCSVSIAKDGELISFTELNNGFTHAENLHMFIHEILEKSNLKPRDLSAIAVSKGPGSYTGLRIGVSTAKGLAYALKKPLLSVDTLRLMAHEAVLEKKESVFYCPMIDARRMEVYTTIYDQELKLQNAIEALILDGETIQKFKSYGKIYFFGDGMAKSKKLLGDLHNAFFIENIVPSAKYMGQLSFEKFSTKQFEDLAYFEPFYLKDFMILKKKGS